MEKRQLLSVTGRDNNLEEGVSFAITLEKAMNEYIVLLLVQKDSNIMDGIGNLMIATSLADAEEHDTACQNMAAGSEETEGRYKKKIGDLLGPDLVSISRMNRTPKPKRVFRIFARSPGSMHMMLSLGIRSNL